MLCLVSKLQLSSMNILISYIPSFWLFFITAVIIFNILSTRYEIFFIARSFNWPYCCSCCIKRTLISSKNWHIISFKISIIKHKNFGKDFLFKGSFSFKICLRYHKQSPINYVLCISFGDISPSSFSLSPKISTNQ